MLVLIACLVAGAWAALASARRIDDAIDSVELDSEEG